MNQKSLIRVLAYLTGGVFSVIITMITVLFIYTYTMSSFKYGKTMGQALTEEKPLREIEITLEEGATIDEVSLLLEEKGIIENALIYKLESKLKGTDSTFSAGVYTVDTRMDSNQINAALRKKDANTTEVKITILEGYSTVDIAKYLEDKGIVTAEEFIETCNTGDFRYGFLKDIPERENRLDGYLFPDTYLISENADSEEIIDKMLTRFDEICTNGYRMRAEEMGISIDEAITIASIIEKEIRREEERGMASSVIQNRLEMGMPLQMCSTVIYVLDKRKDRLTDEDLKVDSPYNTYVNAGLPPGPICNPGQACIEAALNPDETNLLYFVVKDEETGEHFFTDDYDKFINAKIEYKQNY